jgi:hypothetical protein
MEYTAQRKREFVAADRVDFGSVERGCKVIGLGRAAPIAIRSVEAEKEEAGL